MSLRTQPLNRPPNKLRVISQGKRAENRRCEKESGRRHDVAGIPGPLGDIGRR